MKRLKYFLLGSFATAFFLYGVAMVLWRYRHHEGRRHSVLPGGAVWNSIARDSRARLIFVGLGQSGGRAIPDLWAGRVRRRAHARSPPCSHRSEGRDVCLHVADLRRRIWRVGKSLVLGPSSYPRCYDVIGNLAALVQTNVKPWLAYSSIAHAGYILVAFARPRRSASPPSSSTSGRTC